MAIQAAEAKLQAEIAKVVQSVKSEYQAALSQEKQPGRRARISRRARRLA